MGRNNHNKDHVQYIPDSENPLVSEEDENWGRPMYLSSESRLTLCDAMENGSATPEMLKYAASLIRDPAYPPNRNLIQFSKWWREIDDIELLFEKGFTAKGYKKLAEHLREGQVDQLFLRFAAEILEDAAEIKNLPKRPRRERNLLTTVVGFAFEKAQGLGIKGERRKLLLSSKFNMPFKTLEQIYGEYCRVCEEVSLEDSRARQESIERDSNE